jgi:hypothetical protein
LLYKYKSANADTCQAEEGEASVCVAMLGSDMSALGLLVLEGSPHEALAHDTQVMRALGEACAAPLD